MQIGTDMDTTDIFLNRLADTDEVYSTISKRIGSESITDGASLSKYLEGIDSTMFRIYLSCEDMTDTPADKALECFKKAAEANENIKIQTIVDEFVNLVDENDRIISKSLPRSYVHRRGIVHPTVHIWFIRRRDMGVSVLLQKRAHAKEICPDCYDVSAAGHVTQGGEFRHTALREVHEELGIEIPSNKLEFIGIRHSVYENGDINDAELTAVYIYRGDIHRNELTLQKSEVSEVYWAEIDELISLMKHNRIKCCVSLDELTMIKKAVY